VFNTNPMEKRKRWKNLKFNRVLQDLWVTKTPWEKVVLGANGKVNMVRCHVCLQIKDKERLLVHKIWQPPKTCWEA
jgi:hypothetical protein